MAAPTLIQERDTDTLTLTTTPQALSGTAGSFDSNITAGSTIVIVLMSLVGAQTYTITDDVDGSYTELVSENDGDAGSRYTKCLYRENATGGATTISLSIASGTQNFVRVKVFEISPTASSPIYSSIAGTAADASGNVYPCSADATVIDVPNPNFAIAAVTPDGSTSGFSAASGWTIAQGGGVVWGCQYRSGSALTNERGNIVGSGTIRDYAGIIVAFEEPSGGGATGSPFAAGSLGLMGVGL